METDIYISADDRDYLLSYFDNPEQVVSMWMGMHDSEGHLITTSGEAVAYIRKELTKQAEQRAAKEREDAETAARLQASRDKRLGQVESYTAPRHARHAKLDAEHIEAIRVLTAKVDEANQHRNTLVKQWNEYVNNLREQLAELKRKKPG